ncbi:MAG: GAF domain-containing protein, partial [Candidatus Methylomirabilales bacterium]
MASVREPRGNLFRKYVVLFVALVSGALLASGLIEIYFSYQENKTALVRIQREKAEAAASKIEQFVREIEHQIGWTAGSPWGARATAADQRRLDYLRLLRQVPAVTEVSHLDPAGREQLRVSRLAMDLVGSQMDFSLDLRFSYAKSGKTYFSPVYFRKESEPYMAIAMAGSGKDAGVTVAEVNLKFIWEVVSQIKIGKAGYAYVVDASGRLIAHPDISLVLQMTDLSQLPEVQAARTGSPQPAEEQEEAKVTRDNQGRQVLSVHSAIAALGWFVFVDVPLGEAFAPLYASIFRTALLLVLGVALSVLASLALARKMVTPIRALQTGAARIGAGELGHRIEVKTGDELEALADQFNRTADQLQESYANLEQKVAARTRELSETLEQQTATSEILKVISRSTSDLEPVMETLIEHATRLCGADHAHIFTIDGEFLRPAVAYGASPYFGEYLERNPLRVGPGSAAGRAAFERRTVHIHDVLAEPGYQYSELQEREGYRTVLAVPMLREEVPVGVITIRKKKVGSFTDKQIELLATFADQAVIAIENVRLFQEVQARTEELARSVKELKALGEVSQAVSSTLDLQTVLSTIVAHAVQLTGTDGGAIYEYDEQTQEFLLRATHQTDEELIEALRAHPIRIGEGAVGRAAAVRAAVQIPDILAGDAYTARLRGVMAKSGFRASLAIPLLREDRIIGGLVVRRKSPGDFPHHLVDLLRTFATQSVLAIQNARLFREIEEKGRQLESLSRNMEQLYRLSTAMQEPLSLKEQLTRVLEAARQVVAIDRFYIWAVTTDGDRLAGLAGAGFSQEEWKEFEGAEIPLVEAGAMYKSYREEIPLVFNEQNPLPPELYLKPPYSELKVLHAKSFLVVPMIARGRPVGLLGADNKQSWKPILPHTVELLQTFAAHAAVAVENARLFREIEDKGRQLEIA